MKRFLLLLEPKGWAWRVADAALKKDFSLVLVTADRAGHDAARLQAPYHDARRHCHRIIDIPNWDDHEALLDKMRQLEAEGRVQAAFANRDEVVEASAILRERYGLPTTSPKALPKILNKRRAREVLLREGLSQLEVVLGSLADGWREWPAGKQYFFKSAYGLGKLGVRGPLADLGTLASAKADWLNSAAYCNSVNHRYLHRGANEYYLEEAFLGADLLSVEGLWLGGRFHVLGLSSRFMDWLGNPLVEMGGAFPWPHPYRDAIVARVEAAHRTLGVGPDAGPTHTEVLIRGEEIEICEVNHRFGGSELLQIVTLALELDVAALLLDWAAGVCDLTFDTTPRRYVALQAVFAPPKAGDVLHSITFPDEPDVADTLQYHANGTPVGDRSRFSNLVGSFMVAAPTYEAAVARAKALLPAVLVNGISAAY